VSKAVDSQATLQPLADPLSLNPKLSGEFLHIVNAEPGELPTPIEAPPRTSHEAPQVVPISDRETSAPVSPISPIAAAPSGPRPLSGPRPKTGEEPRPASFREILAIKNTPDRIAKYNETRHQFANSNTGIDNWLGRTLAAHPEHRDVAVAARRPSMGAAGLSGPRHKATASITRVFSKGDSSQSGSAYANSGAAEYKPGPSSGSDQRASVGKNKDLGKDILNKAGVLGGKGMKEAKGLFSKGKSRFRSSGTEKVDN